MPESVFISNKKQVHEEGPVAVWPYPLHIKTFRFLLSEKDLWMWGHAAAGKAGDAQTDGRMMWGSLCCYDGTGGI